MNFITVGKENSTSIKLYFKVWGSARDDVFIVGQNGAALHYDGTAWKRVVTGTHATLLTVTGRSSSDVWAVGGNYVAVDPSTTRRGIVVHRGGGAPALR